MEEVWTPRPSEEECWELEDDLVAAAGQANAAVAALVQRLEQVLATGAWEGWGVRSAAHWLSWKCGITPYRARALVRVARRLEELPRTREAFMAGRLSEAAVIAITRVGTPENESTLLDYARNGTITQLEKVCGTYQKVLTEEERQRLENRGPKRRYIGFFPDELDESMGMSGRFDFEDGQAIQIALEAELEKLFEQRRADQAAAEAEATAEAEAEAGGAAASSAAATGTDGSEAATNGARPSGTGTGDGDDDRDGAVADEWGAGFDPDASHHEHDRDHHEDGDAVDDSAEADTSGGGPGRPARPVRTTTPELPRPNLGDALVSLARRRLDLERNAGGHLPDRFQSVIHVRLRDLVDGTAVDDAFWSRDGTAISADLARMLTCDSPRRLLLEHDGLPLDIGRATQSIPPHLRRALETRDRHRCQWPECTARRRLHAHHVIFWANGGRTALENLVLLCPWHHRLVHVEKFQVRYTRLPGRFSFHRPDGTLMPTDRHPPPVAPDQLELRTDIDHTTAACDWAGDHLDLDLAIHVLLQADRRLHDPPERQPEHQPEPVAA